MDTSSVDFEADRCRDFYRFACGRWQDAAVVPPRGHVERARELVDRATEGIYAELLEGCDGGRCGGDRQRLHGFYRACIDADPIDLRPWRARLQDDPIEDLLLDLHELGIHAFFRYEGVPDPADTTAHRGQLRQGTLAIADRDVLVAHLKGFVGSAAPAVADLELALAAKALPFELDEFGVGPEGQLETEHPLTLPEVAALVPSIDWDRYFERVGAAPPGPINVKAPEYFAELEHILAATPASTLRPYLRWKLEAAFPPLPADAGERKAACRLAVLRGLGVELSREFAAAALGVDARDAARAVAATVQARVVASIEATAWLSPAARDATAAKLVATDLKVGFPDAWPPTSDAPLSDDHWDNVLATRRFEQHRIWDRATRPRERAAWEMIVRPNEAWGMAAARLTIVNGYPDQFTNSIILPAASLQPPMFDGNAPPEVNYATFGTLVGHELVHVAENYLYDGDGRARTLWTDADLAARTAQARCLVDQASAAGLDGELTVEENVADLGGIRMAYDAMATAVGDRLHRVGEDGFTAQQRFFVAYGQRWCTAIKPELAAEHLRTDYHAPPRFRVNAILGNVPEFAEAFDCPVPRDPCRVW